MKDKIAIIYTGAFPELLIDGKACAKRNGTPVTVSAVVAVELVSRGDFKTELDEDGNDIEDFVAELEKAAQKTIEQEANFKTAIDKLQNLEQQAAPGTE